MFEEFPDILRVEDLIKMKLVKSRQHAYLMRKENRGPKWKHLTPHNIIYFKEDVIQWLRA